jgi:putative FmdB family regulatory protein
VPTYSYACTECGHEFDAVQSIRDGTLTTCPSCQGVLRKVFHPVGVAFKGSGFYRTDSRADSKAAAKAADSGKGSGDGAAKESSSTGSAGSSGSDSTASGTSKKEPAAKAPTGNKGSAPSKSTSSSSD